MQPRTRYTARITGEQFGLQLQFESPTVVAARAAGLVAQGVVGRAGQLLPQPAPLAVSNSAWWWRRTLPIDPTRPARAWMNHEWSEALLADDAVGGDWIGMNLHDGSAPTAFRLRRRWIGAVGWWIVQRRGPDNATDVLSHRRIGGAPCGGWISPQSGARYPVNRWEVQTRSAPTVNAVLDAQELDSSASHRRGVLGGLSRTRPPRQWPSGGPWLSGNDRVYQAGVAACNAQTLVTAAGRAEPKRAWGW